MTKETRSIQNSQSKAIASVQRKRMQTDTGTHITDNRPEAIMQRKLRELANTSTQSMQLKSLTALQQNSTIQKQQDQKEVLLQRKFTHSAAIQLQTEEPNNTGLPDNLKNGIENLSGYGMNDVKVHYNSSQPETLQAHAYAQGTDIHIAPGQEKHLPHEAWHVVQQKQGRVKPTKQLKGTVPVNDDAGLEKEADVMGAKAMKIPFTRDLETSIQPKISMVGDHQPETIFQRKQKTSQLSSIIQKYSESTRFKTSDNNQYRVDKAGKDEVGVKDGATIPSPTNLMTNTGNTWYGYKRYQYSGQYENDCLQFAQRLAREIAGLNNGEMFKVNIAGIPMNFAVNGSHTQAADANFGQNSATNPAIGEAYSTVPKTGAVLAGCSFHIAAVVAKDGSDNITCEADAGDVGRTTPVFDMYETNVQSNATFHAIYKTSYGGNVAVTGKLAL